MVAVASGTVVSVVVVVEFERKRHLFWFEDRFWRVRGTVAEVAAPRAFLAARTSRGTAMARW
jgi:hypothetical protein